MADELIPLWNKLDEHTKQISVLETKQAVDSNRLDSMEKNHAEMCRQLVLTEGKLMQSITQVSNKQDDLIAAHHKAEGAKSAIKYIPTLLQVAVLITTLIVAFKTFTH